MLSLSSLQVDSVLSYLVALFVPAFDAVVPILPSESAVIALGVATAQSVDPRIAGLVALAALGAFVGDNLCYLIGRRLGPWAERVFLSSPRGARRKAWAEQTLKRFGARLIVACRFIPGGRTVVTLTCGMVGYPPRQFIRATAAGGVIWATYAFFVGRLGGQAFADRPWVGLLLALGFAGAATVLIELIRRVLARRRQLERTDH